MSKIEQIKLIIKENNLELSGQIINSELDKNKYFLFIETNRNEENQQIPSNLKLKQVATLLKNLEFDVEFILTNKHNENIEGGVRATILYQFGDRVRNSFVSTDGKNAFLWLVPKKILSSDDVLEIENKIKIIFSSAGLVLKQVYSTNTANLPSKLAVLSIIKIISPAGIEDIKSGIEKKGFTIPPTEWLSKTLDSLRKTHMVTRRKDGLYILSLGGLRACGTIKNSRSPDIVRLLDLARRRR